MTFRTPILLIAFNRLETTKEVFETIRRAQPQRLYIAGDGARLQRPGELEKVEAVRNYVLSRIDWDCQVKTLFRETNLGCRMAVSTAIDWFFEHETEGIILEDDCLPDPSFFAYAEELLSRYRDDERVMVIAGNHFHGQAHQPSYSYFFSHFSHCWGWASWRRAWQLYDREMSQWPALRNTDWLMMVGNGNHDFRRYWTRMFDMVFEKKINTWDYQWVFSCWSQSGLTILPAANLIRNIGFGAEATHTTTSGGSFVDLPLESLAFPLSHPPTIVRDYKADRWTDQNFFRIQNVQIYRRVYSKVIRQLSLQKAQPQGNR